MFHGTVGRRTLKVKFDSCKLKMQHIIIIINIALLEFLKSSINTKWNNFAMHHLHRKRNRINYEQWMLWPTVWVDVRSFRMNLKKHWIQLLCNTNVLRRSNKPNLVGTSYRKHRVSSPLSPSTITISIVTFIQMNIFIKETKFVVSSDDDDDDMVQVSLESSVMSFHSLSLNNITSKKSSIIC